MSRGPHSKGKARKRKKKAVLLFGEDKNDREAIQELAEGLCPALAGHVQIRRHPLVLVKNVNPVELASRKRSLRAQVAADRVRFDVRGVLVHEDCDAVEPAHEALAARYADAFKDADYRVHPVLPAWELEAWWLLWPDELGEYRASWRAPTEFRGKHVGKLRNAKERLRRAVRPKRMTGDKAKRFPDYEESDSPGIARLLRERGCLDSPQGRSDSYAHFQRELTAIKL